VLAGRWSEDQPFLERTLAEAQAEEHCPLCRLVCDRAEDCLPNEDITDRQTVGCVMSVRKTHPSFEYIRKGWLRGLRCFLFELHLHTNGRIYSAHLDILPQKGNMYLEKRELAMTRRVVSVTFGIVDLRKWLDLDDQYDTLTHSAGQISLSPLISNGHFRVIDVSIRRYRYSKSNGEILRPFLRLGRPNCQAKNSLPASFA
jgi:hypothetical protein